MKTGTQPGSRLVGIDLARLVAVAGMMASHTSLGAESVPAALTALIDGPPSTLFAVLGGVSVVLAARARLAEGDRVGAVCSTVIRGLVVAALGVLVAPLAFMIYVVLVPFGVAIMVSSVLLLAPTWLLGVLLAVIGAFGGSTVVRAGATLPSLMRGAEGSEGTNVMVAAANDVLLTGAYPALIWLGYLIVGMLVARLLLAARAKGRERTTLLQIGGAGAVLTGLGVAASEFAVRVLGPAVSADDPDTARDILLGNGYGVAQSADPIWQMLAAPHTGTPADIARTVGIALLVIAVVSVLVAVLPAAGQRLLAPLRAAGAAPLTIYVVHGVTFTLLAGTPETDALGIGTGLGGWLLQFGFALSIGLVLGATGARGPLERLVGWVANLAPHPLTTPQSV